MPCHAMPRHAKACQGMPRHGMAWQGMARHAMAWHATACLGTLRGGGEGRDDLPACHEDADVHTDGYGGLGGAGIHEAV